MGAYLSVPVRTKDSFQGEATGVSFGGASMQGWRRTMEDAHVAETNLGDMGADLFGVFDGHGGAEVARFCARHIGSELRRSELFQRGELGPSLVRVFHRMDEMLLDTTHWTEVMSYAERNDAVDGGNGEPNPVDLLKKWFETRRDAGANAKETTRNANTAAAPMKGVDPSADLQSGCTAVVALLTRTQLVVANAGDSRAVVSVDGRAIALSEDHKPTQDRERNRIVAAGGFVSDIGGVARVNANLNLSRAIGDLRYKTNKDISAAEQIITAEPDITVTELTPEHEFLLIACDGVWDVMNNQEAVDFVRMRLYGEGRNGMMRAEDVACELVDHCLADDPKETRGVGCDNMTAVIVQLHHGEKRGE